MPELRGGRGQFWRSRAAGLDSKMRNLQLELKDFRCCHVFAHAAARQRPRESLESTILYELRVLRGARGPLGGSRAAMLDVKMCNFHAEI